MERTRTAGFILCAAALATVVAMAFHPSDVHARGVGAAVHASMITLLALMGWGFLQFALARGITGAWVSAGLVAYAVSMFAHIEAGTINGFVVPALIEPAVSHDIFRFSWQANQAFAKLGMIAGSIAYVFWSIDLWHGSARSERLLGASGAVIGIAVPALLLSGLVRLDVHGALLLYGLQALWAVMVGVAMIRGLIQSSGKEATSS